MENQQIVQQSSESSPLKLNLKRTIIIGFAFFGILLFWQVYDSWCSPFLTRLFQDAFNITDAKEVQYLVGIIMALDNLAALILLPIFGKLSDKTKTPIGKRMPYILVGTLVSAICFPFIPVAFHYNNAVGVIILMAIVVIFMMMYRNPAVSLMPDMTSKPLRSKANAIINIMGYIGGAFATVVGIVFVLSQYLGTETNKDHTWQYNNIWAIEIPFLVASALMIVSCLVLFFSIKENKIAEEVKLDMERGEAMSEVKGIADDNQKMSKNVKTMLILILLAEFFWFMADNGIGTFMQNYTISYLQTSSGSNMINTIVGGVGSVIGFVVGGIIASKIGRKWTVFGGLGITVLSLLLWSILSFALADFAKGSGEYPWYLYIVFFVKGFGMSLVHVNSYPMVVELCSSKKIGQFTGYYYASSMIAQTVTPMLFGLLLLNENFDFTILPVYALICTAIALGIFFFVKNVETKKTDFKKGLESLDQGD